MSGARSSAGILFQTRGVHGLVNPRVGLGWVRVDEMDPRTTPFQTRGPWTAKLRSPYFVLVLGTTIDCSHNLVTFL